MRFNIRLNDGLRGYDDKIVGFGISVWNKPYELYLDLLFWTVVITWGDGYDVM